MSDRRAGGRIALAAVSLLVLGAAGGIAADRLLHRPAHGIAVQSRRLHDDAIAALIEELELRPDQHTQVTAILDARQPLIDQVWRDTHIRLLDVLNTTIAELEAVLDPVQTERLHAIVRRLHGDQIPLEPTPDTTPPSH